MRILIAEDEKDLNRILTEQLKSQHYSVDSCFNGRDALDYLDSAEYDALILDIMMPVLDGLSVLKTLRKKGSSLPVLLLTAKDSVEDRVGVWTPEPTIIWSSPLPLRNCWPGSGSCSGNPRKPPGRYAGSRIWKCIWTPTR